MNITSEQFCAARCYFDWTRVGLAKAAKVSPETIENFETGVWRPNINTREAITGTSEACGLEFIEGGAKRKAACENCGYRLGIVVPQFTHEQPSETSCQ